MTGVADASVSVDVEAHQAIEAPCGPRRAPCRRLVEDVRGLQPHVALTLQPDRAVLGQQKRRMHERAALDHNRPCRAARFVGADDASVAPAPRSSRGRRAARPWPATPRR